MKLIIAAGSTKREIEGPFALCGSEEDLRRIARTIDAALEGGFTYGWVDVVQRPVVIANTPPARWDEPDATGTEAEPTPQKSGTDTSSQTRESKFAAFRTRYAIRDGRCVRCNDWVSGPCDDCQAGRCPMTYAHGMNDFLVRCNVCGWRNVSSSDIDKVTERYIRAGMMDMMIPAYEASKRIEGWRALPPDAMSPWSRDRAKVESAFRGESEPDPYLAVAILEWEQMKV